MKTVSFATLFVVIALVMSCGQSNGTKTTESQISQNVLVAQTPEEAKIAAELRETKIAERDAKLVNELKADEIVGHWTFKDHTISGTITIFKVKGKYRGRIVFSDKSIHWEDLAKEGDDVYYVIENGRHNESGEYYRIFGTGVRVCDKDGDIGWFTQEAY